MKHLKGIIYFSFNEKSSILLFFFINALLFSILVLKNAGDRNKTQSAWLATFLFLGALYITPFMCGYAGWYGKDGYREFLFFAPLQQLFLIGPAFYFYLKSCLDQNFKWKAKYRIHFLPALSYLVYSLMIFIVDVFVLEEFYFYADSKDKDLDFWYQLSGLFSMLFYLYLSVQHYLQYRRQLAQEVSYADEIAFKWMQHFALAFGLILVLRVFFFILNPEWGQFGNKYWYYLSFSTLLLYIAVSGYSHSLRFKFSTLLRQYSDLDTSLKTFHEVSDSKEVDLELQKWKIEIDNLFEKEKLYQNPSLNLSDLAQQLGSNRNIISKAINQEYNRNFNDFVNEKRVEALMAKLKKGEHKKHTLLALAYDCGFNSKTTFNRAFKKYSGLSPNQYIVQNQL